MLNKNENIQPIKKYIEDAFLKYINLGFSISQCSLQTYETFKEQNLPLTYEVVLINERSKEIYPPKNWHGSIVVTYTINASQKLFLLFDRLKDESTNFYYWDFAGFMRETHDNIVDSSWWSFIQYPTSPIDSTPIYGNTF